MPIIVCILAVIYGAIGVFFMARGIREAVTTRDLTVFGTIAVVAMCASFIFIWAPLWIYYEIKFFIRDHRYEGKHLGKKSGTTNGGDY